MRYLLALVCIALLAAVHPVSAADIVRQTKTVQVGKISETWQLVWHGQPKALCAVSEGEGAMTCPCTGFAYGEQGDLSLVRKRNNRVVESLPLNSLFRYGDVEKGKAGLQLRTVKESEVDRSFAGDHQLPADVQARPTADVMTLKDYDHDGRATEFLILLGNIACGHQMYAALGVTRKVPYLHLLRTHERPRVPLIMDIEQWNALLIAVKPTKVREWNCGDHGSDWQTDFVLYAHDGHIHVTERSFKCQGDNKPPRLIFSRPWRSDF